MAAGFDVTKQVTIMKRVNVGYDAMAAALRSHGIMNVLPSLRVIFSEGPFGKGDGA